MQDGDSVLVLLLFIYVKFAVSGRDFEIVTVVAHIVQSLV